MNEWTNKRTRRKTWQQSESGLKRQCAFVDWVTTTVSKRSWDEMQLRLSPAVVVRPRPPSKTENLPPPPPSQMFFGWEDVLAAARIWIWIVLPYIISLISCQCSHICWLCAITYFTTHNLNHTRHLIGWLRWISLRCCFVVVVVVDALSLDHYQVSKSFLHGHDTYVNVFARLHGSATQHLSFLILIIRRRPTSAQDNKKRTRIASCDVAWDIDSQKLFFQALHTAEFLPSSIN